MSIGASVDAIRMPDPPPSLWGRPYIDLTPFIRTAPLADIDREIAYALTQVPVEYTGGSHRSMGIIPASMQHEPYVDYGEVIAKFSRDEFQRFVSLADSPGDFDLERQADYRFGEEQEYPLNRRQMLYLKYQYGVYFPWQVFYEMIPTLNWADKTSGLGKDFTNEAKRWFPKTIAFVKTLPFAQIGRCNILGLEANHHGTIHQDGDPFDSVPDQFITVCPRGDKRLFLWNETTATKTIIDAQVYWFNDHGFHGVEPDPYFRYSFRVDGVFHPDFLAAVRRRCERAR